MNHQWNGDKKVDAAMVFRLGDLELDPMAHVNHQLEENLGVTLVHMDLRATKIAAAFEIGDLADKCRCTAAQLWRAEAAR